ncbi:MULTISPECIES: ABC transporter permease [Halomonas]|uniref:Arginine ABC transporter permease protein ArtM n=3 Tax=Halomonas TaxID=2745 RepID=A0AAU7KF52_9GAMM|nr:MULTISPECIES: ABC transporter permease [Halomonas]MBR9771572.1 ABC transporter permease [Gammaproteobacteria bacterium]MBR9879480.1 ABC transporter permease [Gammaproteobacteria bacterium]MBS8270051.1 ABC transporter permease subunit [Halomonas litopenaei]MBY5943439.1 ABC transporter permease [Halomonas sp. DP5N14-9]MBY6110153.1 ABC transporter permease [Halomonas sp. DP1Y21-3]|tara:strand:+ start:1368 stop:2099 length:732 start_codon:yes stop_codon:yes gene_type:complete
MDSLLASIEALLADNTIFTLDTLSYYGEGLTTTVQLVFLSLIVGLIAAVPLAIGRGSKRRWIKMPIFFYTYVFRGTPLLVQLYLIYYGVVFVEGIQDTWLWVLLEKPFFPALVAFSLNTAAYTTEIFHGAIKATPRGEIEAARAYGMRYSLMMRRIVLPSAFRRALPAYGNEVIFMLHASAIASVVTIMDLTGAARFVYARYYAPFDAFLFVAAIYLCLTFAILYLFRYLEKRLLAHLKPASG